MACSTNDAFCFFGSDLVFMTSITGTNVHMHTHTYMHACIHTFKYLNYRHTSIESMHTYAIICIDSFFICRRQTQATKHSFTSIRM